MLSQQRKQAILTRLARDKQVISRELSQLFSVSEDSIRRDLREMAAEGLLQRVHGGALAISPAIGNLEVRKNVHIEAKQRIARKTLDLLSPHTIVLVDGGTTNEQLIQLIPADLALTIVTHSPTIAVGLIDHPLIDVIMIGGQLYKHSMVTVGAAMLESVRHIRADLFIMGVTGVHPEAGFTTGNFEEACVKRALAQQAAETIVMASPEKINAVSPFTIGDVAMASTVITDTPWDEKNADLLLKQGLTLV